MKKIIYTMLLLSSLTPVAQADDITSTIDSTQLFATNDVPVKKTYVLSSGGYELYCEGGRGNNCQYRVADQQCMPGYQAYATTSVVGAGADKLCAIRHIYLEPHPVTPTAANDAYYLNFSNAYAAGSSWFCSKYVLTINYTIYCSPQIEV